MRRAIGSRGILFALARKGYLYAKMGRRAEADHVKSTLTRLSSERFVPPYQFALIHAGWRDRATALDWLEGLTKCASRLVFLPPDPIPSRRTPLPEAAPTMRLPEWSNGHRDLTD